MQTLDKVQFRTSFAQNIFNQKYKHEGCEDWESLSRTLIEDVCGDLLSKEEKDKLIQYHTDMKFIAGGRYLYYAGRDNKFYNNCFLLKAEEDSREDWANLSWKAESCLMTGGGIGIDYSIYREAGAPIAKTGGVASGPIPKMYMTNEIGRNVMQGGSRRSAIYGSLNWLHPDAKTLIHAKDWDKMEVPGTNGKTIADLKEADFNYPAPLDMTNISLNYDNKFLDHLYGPEGWFEVGGKIHIQPRFLNGDSNKIDLPDTYLDNVANALRTAEPGFSFNFGSKENETLRNACTEVTSEDDSDVCNLGSINLAKIEDRQELADVVNLASKFLLCGTLKADLPYDKIKEVRVKNRRLGLGLMGVHEWLLKRGERYEVTPELRKWLKTYMAESEHGANTLADKLGVNRPIAYRAIAPNGSIGNIAGTTTGIEPIYAVAYKRRYLKNGSEWHFEYVFDATARAIIEEYQIDPERVETSYDLAKDYERRIRFQADVQDYIDQSISSTINLPKWGTKFNNEETVEDFARVLAKYAHRLRGMTVYPDQSRGGQPLSPVHWETAIKHEGEVFKEVAMDVCDLTGGGTCGS